MAGRVVNRALLVLGLGGLLPGLPAVAQPCAALVTVHVPIEMAKEPLGLRDESRAQYLDRRYRAGVWQTAAGEFLALAADGPDAVRLRLPAQAGVRFERVDIVAESQLDYRDVRGARSVRLGHREIGSYPLAPDASSELSVPVGVMRESGALLAIVTLRRAPDPARVEVQVAALAVQRADCERRVYVSDRATAIRLNRPRAGE